VRARREWRAAVRGAAGVTGGVRGVAGVWASGRAWACVQWARRGAAGLGCRPLAGFAAPPIRVRDCLAMMRGVSSPRPDRWRGRAGHVTGQAPGPCHVGKLAAPPYMVRQR